MKFRINLPILAFILLLAPVSSLLAPSDPPSSNEDRLLDAIFRIDIRSIRATLTYNPEESTVDGHCELIFRMRPGQKRPLFHFNPISRGDIRDFVLQLDEEIWNVSPQSGPAIIKVLGIPGSSQKAVEIRRDVSDDQDHFLALDYRLRLLGGYPRFSTNVDDYFGRGNEEIFPTINSPEELARHQITLRVTGNVLYRCIGSGLVLKIPRIDIQEWTLDTEREVASYTVMFALLPERDTVYEERVINGTPVRVMAFVDGASVAEALATLDSWLPDLASKFGPFPMPRGLSLFLVNPRSGGMEYFGATISSLSALRHEITHMYFGCSTIAKTYRDSWWDEAAASWHVEHAQGIDPIPTAYRSNIVSGRAPYAVGFDIRAYDQGAQMIEAMARKISGRQNMILFLYDLHQRHSFAPFNTLELVSYFQEFSGFDMRQDFINWVYSGKTPALYPAAEDASVQIQTKEIDWTPPDSVMRKYGQRLYSSTDAGRRQL